MSAARGAGREPVRDRVDTGRLRAGRSAAPDAPGGAGPGQHRKSRARWVWMIAVAACGASHAGPVTYSTSASQLCVGATGCGVATQTFGGLVTVSFQPVTSITVNALTRTFTTLGHLRVTCFGGGTSCPSQSLAGLNLFINVTQAAPAAANISLPGSAISGLIRGNGSTATVTLASGTPTASGLVSYRIVDASLPLVPPSTGGGVVTIQGEIIDMTGVLVFSNGFE